MTLRLFVQMCPIFPRSLVHKTKQNNNNSCDVTYNGVQRGRLGMPAMHGPLGKGDIGAGGRGREKGRRRAGDGGRVTGALAGRRKDSGLTRRVLGSSSAVFTWIKI